MGFANTESDTASETGPGRRPRPSPATAVGLGAAAGLTATGFLLLIHVLVQTPAQELVQRIGSRTLKTDSELARHFAAAAQAELVDRRLRAGGPKILLQQTLPPNRSATLHWCWSGVMPVREPLNAAPSDRADATPAEQTPCARLARSDYAPMRSTSC